MFIVLGLWPMISPYILGFSQSIDIILYGLPWIRLLISVIANVSLVSKTFLYSSNGVVSRRVPLPKIFGKIIFIFSSQLT
ncbi:hypothetical protein EHQ71_13000 [Leptospira levettii]|uniref:Uncharacterized protein n=1 Tax=Leptospira levettii TaxID=2023178 RepID=A0ABY2MSX9_9LEPT|nr:hypothetical protein EHQ34_13770 [Leptospira levettii]TGL74411.1 hypothetical protein EHQ60_02840 [Leptospira levettii]TGM30003.1 hypothetical protein EHQ71_13000 [Leptospira levettii]TGM85047.1 hypothetical protein EHR00_16335 [Leptospira levettii]